MSNYAPIPIIERMSAILEIVLKSPGGVRAGDLLRRESIPKTTLYRLLTTMVENDFLSYNSANGLYGIGPKFTMTYISMQEQTNHLREVSLVHLQQLAEQLQETTKLSILSGWEAYVIASVESQQPIRIKIDIGATFPLHAGATGKALMCDFDDASIRKYFKLHARPYTNKTITSIDEMKHELETIRKNGYALDSGEYSPEISAIAVPIKSQTGSTIAALSIPYPSIHRGRINIPHAVELLKQTAAAISLSCSKENTKATPARVIGTQVPDFQ